MIELSEHCILAGEIGKGIDVYKGEEDITNSVCYFKGGLFTNNEEEQSFRIYHAGDITKPIIAIFGTKAFIKIGYSLRSDFERIVFMPNQTASRRIEKAFEQYSYPNQKTK